MPLFPHLHGTNGSPRIRRWRSCRFLLISSFILSVSAFAYLVSKRYIMSDESDAVPAGHYFRYSTVTGIFVQDDGSKPGKGGEEFDYAKSNLGLVDRHYATDDEFDPDRSKTQWQRLEYYIEELNRKAGLGVEYKLLYFGRHGEGEHNVAEVKYGTEGWDCYWSKLEGDDELHWADAHLTPKGEQQALVAHEFWKKALVEGKIPAPQSYYASPLDRCMATASLTFSGLELPADRPFEPLVKELMREVLGVHTCDRRSPKSVISPRWPGFSYEPNFSEPDPLWDAELRESNSQLDHRINTFLDDIFTHDRNTFLSLTSHSGAIGGFLRVLGHAPFRLQTGGVIPVLAKAERVYGKPPAKKIEPGFKPPTCEKPPPPLGR